MRANLNRRNSEAPDHIMTLPNRPLVRSSTTLGNLLISSPSDSDMLLPNSGYFSGQNVCIYEVVPEATVLFVSISDYEELCATLSVEGSVTLLQKVYTAWDQLVISFRVEKIKAIGGTYMVMKIIIFSLLIC
jgi:hypothetical protein